MFSHLEPYAGDPILSLNDAFQKDPRADIERALVS